MPSKYGDEWVFKYPIKEAHFQDKADTESFTINYPSK